MSYQEFFQKYFVVHELWAVKNSFSTYVWSKVDSCFCEFLYLEVRGADEGTLHLSESQLVEMASEIKRAISSIKFLKFLKIYTIVKFIYCQRVYCTIERYGRIDVIRPASKQSFLNADFL